MLFIFKPFQPTAYGETVMIFLQVFEITQGTVSVCVYLLYDVKGKLESLLLQHWHQVSQEDG